MCGIAGLVSPSLPIDSLKATATAMAEAIEHRGPDAMGVWVEQEQKLAFSHRRLSIQDLSESGAQPMHSHSKRYTIAFNGEIYNFLEIKKPLIDAGFEFRGHSDTEVLLCAIEHWGLEQTIAKAKGMFAIALWDSQTKVLTLIRDRIGEKPLYYGVINGSFVFGSELKAIFAHTPAKALTLNKMAIASFLRHGYISAPNSVFEEVKKLSPGCRIDINLAEQSDWSIVNLTPKPYWTVAQSANQPYLYTEQNQSEAISALDEKINKVINEQSIADVPLGAFLSGGIDSTVVSAVLQANTSTAIDTFTIGFEEKSFNEAEFAKEIAKHLGTKHHEHYVNQQDILELVNILPRVYDEPFADASQLPTILVNRFARSELTVCLSGDGGDELFAGYNRYVFTEAVLKKAAALPAVFKSILKALITSVAPGKWDKLYQALNSIAKRKGGAEFGNKLYKMVSLADAKSKAAAYEYLMSYWQQPEQVLKAFNGEPAMQSPLSLEDDFINAAMAWDQQWYLPGDNLTKTDRASMAASLELRAPLLDIELIDFAWTVSPELKVRDGKSKWLLREVLYKYVPKELIERPKMGFSVPISQWIRTDLSAWVDELLDKEFIEKQGIFNYAPIQHALLEHRSGSYDHGKKLWTLLMFQAWFKTNIIDG